MKTWMNQLTLFQKMFLFLLLAVSVPVTVQGMLFFSQSSEQLQSVTDALLQENLQQNGLKAEQVFRSVELMSEQIIASNKLDVLRDTVQEAPFQANLFLRLSLAIGYEFSFPYELTVLPPQIEQIRQMQAMVSAPGRIPEEETLLNVIALNGKGQWQLRSGGEIYYMRVIRNIYTLEHQGIVLFTVPPSAVEDQLTVPASLPQFRHELIDLNRPEHSQIIGDAQDEKLIVSMRQIPGMTLALIAAVPQADLLGPVNEMKRFTAAIISISLLFITVLLFIIIRNFIRPIRFLVGLIRKVQLGGLQPVANHLERRDEVGQLARGYNVMIDRIKDLIHTVRHTEKEKSRVEMQMLIHQMNPHLLYNVLETVKWEADEARQHSIVNMVTALSDLLRYSINNGEVYTTVEREAAHTDNYLQIELMRRGHPFQTVFLIPPPLLHHRMLKLILQPIVENAVKHGLPRAPAGKGKILIHLQRDGDDLVWTVEDNGSGFEWSGPAAGGETSDGSRMVGLPAALSDGGVSREDGEGGAVRGDGAVRKGSAVREDGAVRDGGVGLVNVQNRIRLQHGEGYGIEVERGERGGGRVRIRIPANPCEGSVQEE